MGHWLEGAWRLSFLGLSKVSLINGLGRKKDPGSIYSVCSAYEVLIGEGVVFPSDPIFGALWRVRAPSNVLALIRKLLLNRVQTKENLLRRGVLLQDEEAKCPFCLTDTAESSSHLLSTCSHAGFRGRFGLRCMLGWAI